jgi:hypothetical protein
VSESFYGLQCATFTNSFMALRLIKNVSAGEVIVRHSSRWRKDQMSYGELQDGCIGQERPKLATCDMTQEQFSIWA